MLDEHFCLSYSMEKITLVALLVHMMMFQTGEDLIKMGISYT